jgi:pimeloyl-ACP methyl ester carboxylesterase
MVQEEWVYNHGVRLHYLDSGPQVSSDQVSVFFVPGALASAEVYLTEMTSLAPRRCIAVTLRGRGKSDAPRSGYSFEDQVSDIEAVIGELGLNRFCLMAYSLGVPYAIGYAARHPHSFAGLIIGDYPARYPALTPAWAEKALSATPTRVAPHVIRGLQQESVEISLWNTLNRIQCPVMIICGGQSDSLLTAQQTQMYREHLSNAEILTFEESGHELWIPNYDRFIGAIKQFLERIDSESKS